MKKNTKILLVEDVSTDAELAQWEIKKSLFCEFLCVDTREDFLNALTSFHPDLIVSDLGVDPASVQAGEVIRTDWRIENTGNDPVATALSDRIRVVNTTTGQTLLEEVVLYDPASDGAIGADEGRDRSLDLTIPDGSGSVGDIEIRIVTDVLNELFEFNWKRSASLN